MSWVHFWLGLPSLWAHCWVWGPAACRHWYSRMSPSQPTAGSTSCIYRKNLNLLFLSSSVLLSYLFSHLQSRQEKCDSDSSPFLIDSLKGKHQCSAVQGFLSDTAQCAAGMQLEVLLLTSVRSALGPQGVLQHSLPLGFKRKERKEKLNLFKARQGGHTCFNDRYFLKLVCIWVIMYFSIVGEMRNFTHGIWKSLWLTTLLDRCNAAINFPQQKTCNCIGCTSLSFSFIWMCCFTSQPFNSSI